jgi:hypothetical protein
MRYRLIFIDSAERSVRELNFEADDDDSAMGYAGQQSLNFDMTIELCDGDRQLARITPMTARLYAPDRGDPVLGTA